jgi:acetyltransferase
MTKFATTDGREVFIRHIKRDDAALLVDMFHHLSDQTKRLRFQCGTPSCPEALIWREAIKLCHLEPERQVGLVAIATESNGECAVGTARCVRRTPNEIEAEVGIVVRDDYQRVGLGSRLMVELIQAARTVGIVQFEGWILPENRRMLQMIDKSGLPFKRHTKMGETHVVVSIDKQGSSSKD